MIAQCFWCPGRDSNSQHLPVLNRAPLPIWPPGLNSRAAGTLPFPCSTLCQCDAGSTRTEIWRQPRHAFRHPQLGLEPAHPLRCFYCAISMLATRMGFEPMISAVTGRRIRPTILTCHCLVAGNRSRTCCLWLMRPTSKPFLSPASVWLHGLGSNQARPFGHGLTVRCHTRRLPWN